MARTGSDEEISVKEAAKRLGMTQQGIGQWADKAPAGAVRLRSGRRYLVWPAFPVWHRQQLKSDRAKPTDFDEAKTRKMAADAELAELELERARGDSVSVESFKLVVREIVTKIRAQLLAAPGRYSARIVGVSSLPEAQRQLDEVVRDILNELSEG